MNFSVFRMPIIRPEALSFGPTRDANLFAQTDNELRSTTLKDGTTAEQYIASGQLEKRIARTALIPNFLRTKLRLPTQTGLLNLDEVVAQTSLLVSNEVQ